MRGYQAVTIVGIILVVVGVLILISTAGESEFFFFVFPFFFFGNASSITPIFTGIMILFTLVCLFQILTFKSGFSSLYENTKVERKCSKCQVPLPEGFNYCPICGTQSIDSDQRNWSYDQEDIE
ncbi:MAG: hypothetical protein ACFFED_01385 [Candidatus Thorarchaeota archaeon]